MMNDCEQYESFLQKLTQLLSYPELPEDERIELTREYHLLSSIKDELFWKMLSPEEKQEKRKLTLQKMKRWESESPDLKSSWNYDEIVIEVYSLINKVAHIIQNENLINNNLEFRLYSILLVEMDLINETQSYRKMRHVDYEVFMNITKKVLKLNSIAGLAELITTYDLMYNSWQLQIKKDSK